jgi:predicted ABC-type ATPase
VPRKELIVVGGPNGAGKSTFVRTLLSERPCPYLSADLIATEFPHLDPMSQQMATGREFHRRLEEQLSKNDDFVVETTLSGRSMRDYVNRAKAAGFVVTIYFVYLDSADTCIARVRARVSRGGHNVPDDDIRRRFGRSLGNFWRIYRKIADYWYIVYNSSGELEWVASGEADVSLIHDESDYRHFLFLAGGSDVKADD